MAHIRGHHRNLPARHRVRYNSILFAGSVVFLAGCAAIDGDKKQPPAPTPRPNPVIAAPAPAKPQRKTAREEPREAKEPERVAAINPKSLLGLAPAAVQKLLGAPSSITKSDPSLVWTYAGQGCSFQIVFYPDLKTEDFHALKYGSSTGDNNSCIRNILTVKSNGPS